MRKRILSIALVAIMAIALLAGCSGNTGSPTTPGNPSNPSGPAPSANATVIKVPHYYAETHPVEVALNSHFKAMIEEQSEGRFVVETYPNNILGAEKEFTEGTRMGTIEACVASQFVSENHPILKLANMPWMFDDLETSFQAINDDEVRLPIFEAVKESGIVGQYFLVNGIRAISNNVRPINSLADCRGLKIRMPESSQFVDNGKALGFNVVSMPMSEIFTALQQGVIEGQENPPTTLLQSGWWEVQDYVAMVTHQITFDWIGFSKSFWEKQSEADQAMLFNISKETCLEEYRLYNIAHEADIETLKANGIEFTYPDRTEFKEAGSAVPQKYMDQYPEFKEIAEKARAKEAEYAAKR